MKKPLLKKRLFASALMLIAVAAFGLIVMRVVFYQFEYDPKHYPIDYGRFNFFSYFTVQSNLYVAFYLLCLSLALFGIKRAERIAFSPMVRLTVTTYILVTGAVYCGGIPLGMTPSLYCDGFHQVLLSVVQIFHHMIMPPFMLVLFLAVPSERKVKMKFLPIVAVYPFVYSVFSIIRGAVSDPSFYAYPFYRPDFFWNIFLKDHEMNATAAYLLMLPMLLIGVSLFVLIAFVLAFLQNKITDRRIEKGANGIRR